MNIEYEVMIFSSYFHGETSNNKKETKNFYQFLRNYAKDKLSCGTDIHPKKESTWEYKLL